MYLIGFEPKNQDPFLLFVGNPERELAEKKKNYNAKDEVVYTVDDILFWKFKPSSEIDINPNYKLGNFYSKYTINSHGFRGGEFKKEKQRDAYRIIILGDSITFGLMVSEEKTYYKLLEKMLNEMFPQIKFEVLSAGVPGYTSFQGLHLLKKEILSYSPDMVIVYFGANNEFARSYYTDREYADKTRKTSLKRWSKTLRTYWLLKLISQKLKKNMAAQEIAVDVKLTQTKVRVPPIDFLDDIIKMKDLTDKSGVDMIFIAPPHSDEKLKEEPIAEEYASIVKFLGNYIAVADVDSQFKLKGADSLFTGDSIHPNEKGHEVIAKTILNVAKKRILKFFVAHSDVLARHSFSKQKATQIIHESYNRLISEAVMFLYASNGANSKYIVEPHNIKIVDGYSGRSPYFNGNNASITTSFSLANLRGFSVAFWIKPERQQKGKIVTILDNGHDARQDCVLQSADIIDSTYTFHCFGRDTLLKLPTDKWTHILIAVDLEDRNFRVSINRKKLKTVELPRGVKFGNTPLTFGKLAKLNERYFKGILSEIIVWDRSLAEEDVKIFEQEKAAQ